MAPACYPEPGWSPIKMCPLPQEVVSQTEVPWADQTTTHFLPFLLAQMWTQFRVIFCRLRYQESNWGLDAARWKPSAGLTLCFPNKARFHKFTWHFTWRLVSVVVLFTNIRGWSSQMTTVISLTDCYFSIFWADDGHVILMLLTWVDSQVCWPLYCQHVTSQTCNSCQTETVKLWVEQQWWSNTSQIFNFYLSNSLTLLSQLFSMFFSLTFLRTLQKPWQPSLWKYSQTTFCVINPFGGSSRHSTFTDGLSLCSVLSVHVWVNQNRCQHRPFLSDNVVISWHCLGRFQQFITCLLYFWLLWRHV